MSWELLEKVSRWGPFLFLQGWCSTEGATTEKALLGPTGWTSLRESIHNSLPPYFGVLDNCNWEKTVLQITLQMYKFLHERYLPQKCMEYQLCENYAHQLSMLYLNVLPVAGDSFWILLLDFIFLLYGYLLVLVLVWICLFYCYDVACLMLCWECVTSLEK